MTVNPTVIVTNHRNSIKTSHNIQKSPRDLRRRALTTREKIAIIIMIIIIIPNLVIINMKKKKKILPSDGFCRPSGPLKAIRNISIHTFPENFKDLE